MQRNSVTREAQMTEQIRGILNRNEVNLAVAETTSDLLKMFRKQLQFVLRTDQTEQSTGDEQFELTQNRGRLLPNGTAAESNKPHRKMSAESRRRISEAQRARWAKDNGKTRQKASNAGKPSKLVGWSDADEDKIISFVKSKGEFPVSKVARALEQQLPNRTEGSITQRVYALMKNNKLRRLTRGKTSGKPVLVGAA